MAYIAATQPQRRYIASLQRDMGLDDAALDARCQRICNTTLDGLTKSDASLLISELRREQDAVTLAGFAQKGAAID